MATRLTASQENYLEHILRLGRSAPVRVRDIAGAAGVRLPSVSKAIGRLVDAGLARHEAYGRVEITQRGLRAARLVARRDECLTRLLVDVLGMAPDRAAAEVCRLEHSLDSDVLARLEALVVHAASPASATWRRGLAKRLAALPDPRVEREDVRVGVVEPHVHAGKR
ncbi:MAG: metal-dependent transcriptional regulator [Planctomycetes bacterium]|nr:metal-dependent transcriptional regulator [Planctomycetota bacterium]